MPFVSPDDQRTSATGPRPGQASPSPLTGALGAIKPHAQPLPPNPYDFTSDPLYQRIMALGDLRTEQANSAALSQRTQALIDYGDPDLVRSLGLGEDTAAAAGQNPFSTVAGLKKQEHDRPLALDESLNKENLFYSGHRGLYQSDLANSLLQDRYNANQKERGILGGIETTRLGALGGVADMETTGAQDAADRRTKQLGDTPVKQPPSWFKVPTDSRSAAAPFSVAAAVGGARPGPVPTVRRTPPAPRQRRPTG